MKDKVVNWGVLGCAGIADSAVIPGINAAGNARLYGIASRGSEKLKAFAKKHRPVKTYESYEAMLEDDDIDAIYIPLPNGLHYEWALRAAEMKKHILCEKPLGITAQEVEKLRKICEEKGVYLMEAFAYRHSPLTFKLKELVDSGVIGKLKYIESNFSFILKDRSNVRYDPKLGGGATYDVGCYNINLIRYLSGLEPATISAIGEVDQSTGVDFNSTIMMGFEGGLSAVSYCSFNTVEKCDYTIVGDKGTIHVPVQFNSKGNIVVALRTSEGTKEIGIECPDNYMLEVEQFGRCILDGEKPLIDFKDSINNAKVIDEALKQIFIK